MYTVDCKHYLMCQIWEDICPVIENPGKWGQTKIAGDWLLKGNMSKLWIIVQGRNQFWNAQACIKET